MQDEPQISPELRAKYTGIAWRKALRLEELINEFFDITRFSLSHLTLNREDINLTRMLEQMTFEFQPSLAEKGLSWTLQLTADVHLLCDPDKLERVFDNLFRNAVYYSYPGTAIAVRLALQDGAAVVQVENQGKTIAPEKLSRIFEQFFPAGCRPGHLHRRRRSGPGHCQGNRGASPRNHCGGKPRRAHRVYPSPPPGRSEKCMIPVIKS